MRGAAPPVHPSALPVFLSTEAQGFLARGLRPLCAPPRTPGDFTGLVAPASTCRRSALHPGDFPDAGKVTKGAPRTAALWNPASTKKRPFWCCANACTRAAFYHKKRPICHFEQVGKSVLFFPLVPSREHSVFSIRGAADSLPPRMLDGLSYRKQYR